MKTSNKWLKIVAKFERDVWFGLIVEYRMKGYDIQYMNPDGEWVEMYFKRNF